VGGEVACEDLAVIEVLAAGAVQGLVHLLEHRVVCEVLRVEEDPRHRVQWRLQQAIVPLAADDAERLLHIRAGDFGALVFFLEFAHGDLRGRIRA
jgi:hypothetical protein